MRISNISVGSKIVCCGATAEIIMQGNIGSRVKVLTVPENSGFCLGHQIWSNESVVEIAPGEPYSTQAAAYAKIGSKIPLTLF